MNRLAAATACLVLSCAAGAAELGSFYELGPAPAQARWSAGAVALSAPRYPGADVRRTRLLPAVGVQLPNGFFADPFNGVGLAWTGAPGWQWGVRLTLETGREAEGPLAGMGDIGWRANPGLFANFEPMPGLVFKAAWRAGMASGGQLLHLGASARVYEAPGLSLAVTTTARIASAAYNQAYFGVSPAQSARSGLAAYCACSDFNAAGLGLSLRADLAPQWAGFAGVEVQRLLGDAADSPVVQRATSTRMTLGAAYRF